MPESAVSAETVGMGRIKVAGRLLIQHCETMIGSHSLRPEIEGSQEEDLRA